MRHAEPDAGRIFKRYLPRHRFAHVPGAARRLRWNHAVQLPGDGADVDVPFCDRLWEYVYSETFGKSAPDANAVHGVAEGGGASRWRVSDHSRRQGNGGRPASSSVG